MWFVVLSQVALGADLAIDLEVPSTPPDTSRESVHLGRPVPHVDLPDSPRIPSTHPNLSCQVRDGTVDVRFEARVDAWPELPASGTCEWGGHRLTVEMVEPLSVRWDGRPDWRSVDDALGVWFRQAPEHPTTTFRAVRDDPFLEGAHASTLAGVRCEVHRTGERRMLGIHVGPDSELGTGSCTLPLEDGTERVIPLRVGPA